MGTSYQSTDWLMYNPLKIHQYYKTLPLYRRILARFFDKYRIHKDEYEKWFFEKGHFLPII